MEFLMDPSIWAGLLTLVVLEIVLGIDNLVFIAILADKLPPKQRDKARLLGLSLALIMRLGLLSLISWMVTLTKPLFTVMDFSFSAAYRWRKSPRVKRTTRLSTTMSNWYPLKICQDVSRQTQLSRIRQESRCCCLVKTSAIKTVRK